MSSLRQCAILYMCVLCFAAMLRCCELDWHWLCCCVLLWGVSVRSCLLGLGHSNNLLAPVWAHTDTHTYIHTHTSVMRAFKAAVNMPLTFSATSVNWICVHARWWRLSSFHSANTIFKMRVTMAMLYSHTLCHSLFEYVCRYCG